MAAGRLDTAALSELPEGLDDVLPNLERVFRHLLNSLCDTPTVHKLQSERPQDQ